MSKNDKQTSDEIASLASEVLNDPNSTDIEKSLAGSALAQSSTGKQTGSELEDLASDVLRSDSCGETAKRLAGSVLSQANKER